MSTRELHLLALRVGWTVGAVVAFLSIISACVAAIGQDWSRCLDFAGNAALMYFVVRYWMDRAHLLSHQSVTRTYQDGELTVEHRTDLDGRQSGTVYGRSR